jgi:hypothetical protein
MSTTTPTLGLLPCKVAYPTRAAVLEALVVQAAEERRRGRRPDRMRYYY